MSLLLIFGGALCGCFFSVLVALLGSRRRIGFGWTFLLSIVFTPLVGLVCALISEPLPQNEPTRIGCIGGFFVVCGFLFIAAVIALLLMLVPGMIAAL